VAVAVWLCVSLLGVMLGLALAKFSQAWGGYLLHPGAVWGAGVIVISVALGLIAAMRYRLLAAGRLPPRWSAQAQARLAGMVVLMLAWAALNLILFAGWEAPPPQSG
jgi:hypothetical protein